MTTPSLRNFAERIVSEIEDPQVAQRIADVVESCPRHLFIKRYESAGHWREIWESTPKEDLVEIYQDKVLILERDEAGAIISTNSLPSMVCRLLELLELSPGMRVLEIGSGSGWLVALIARLVGDTGSVVGVEVIERLIEQSRRSLLSLNLHWVEILPSEHFLSRTASIPRFDRVVFTASAKSPPDYLISILKPSGRVLIPLLREDGPNALSLFRLSGDTLVLEKESPAYFVPLV